MESKGRIKRRHPILVGLNPPLTTGREEGRMGEMEERRKREGERERELGGKRNRE